MKSKKKTAVLTEADVIQMMREEWDAKMEGVAGILDELDMQYKQADGAEHDLVSPGLKVKHKESGLLYTVDSMGMQDVTLQTPEGEEMTVNFETLEQDYELD